MQSSAKLRFFAVYLLSVGFVVVIVTFLMGMKNPKEQSVAVSSRNEEIWQANQYLHSRVAELNGMYAAALANPARRFQNVAIIQKAEAAFASSLDSVDRVIAEKDDATKSSWEQLTAAFRQGVESRKPVLQAYNNQPEAPANTAANTKQLTDLQQQLQQRDVTIAELNQRLASRPATASANNTQADAELSRINASLRSSVEKLRSENESLNRSYKAVVDDHKRVLAQLQSARKP